MGVQSRPLLKIRTTRFTRTSDGGIGADKVISIHHNLKPNVLLRDDEQGPSAGLTREQGVNCVRRWGLSIYLWGPVRCSCSSDAPTPQGELNEASQAMPAKAESEPATWPLAMAESKCTLPLTEMFHVEHSGLIDLFMLLASGEAVGDSDLRMGGGRNSL